ncbi:hypothetical protein OAO87_01910, partial [bacterium]|nr:hypothetical protein [bacterium]
MHHLTQRCTIFFRRLTHMTCSWLGTSALVADKLWDIAAMLPEVGTVPYGRCCGRGRLSRCGFPIVALAEMEAARRDLAVVLVRTTRQKNHDTNSRKKATPKKLRHQACN